MQPKHTYIRKRQSLCHARTNSRVQCSRTIWFGHCPGKKGFSFNRSSRQHRRIPVCWNICILFHERKYETIACLRTKGYAIQPGKHRPRIICHSLRQYGHFVPPHGHERLSCRMLSKGNSGSIEKSEQGSIGLFAKQSVGALLRNGPSQRKFELCPESYSKCKPRRRHHRNAFGYGQRRHLLCLQTGFKQSGQTVVGCICKGRQSGFHTAQAQSNQLPHHRLQRFGQ